MRLHALLLALLAAAPPAAAELYRWVDPDSGSVKFSSYPPPWHGDPERERRAPKVEVISAPAAQPKPRPEPPRAPPKPKPAAAKPAAQGGEPDATPVAPGERPVQRDRSIPDRRDGR